MKRSQADAPAGVSWNPQLQVGGGTSTSPSITFMQGGMGVIAWRGPGTDSRIFYVTQVDGDRWSGQRQSPGSTSHGPAVTGFGHNLVMAWKGVDTDPRLFYAVSRDNGHTWSDQMQVGGTTSHGPALAVFNGRLYLAWKGGGDDQRLFYTSTPDAQNWDGQRQAATQERNSGDAPSLTVFQNQLYIGWNDPAGATGTEWMYSSASLDGLNWRKPVRISADGGSDQRPSITASRNQLHAAWKGHAGDPGIYYSTSVDGIRWTPQERAVPDSSTSHAPSLADNDHLWMVWKRAGNDDRMFFSQGYFNPAG